MPESRSSQANDQEFLDEVFDRIVEYLEEGRRVDCAELAAGREHLLRQVEELVRLAQQVAVGVSHSLPNVPGYTLLSELGRGGMGTVFLAQQERLGGRPVALKLLPASIAHTASARQRFRAEARAIARLRHPNIVAVHDVVDEGGVYAYAMEWVEGRSLADLLEHLRQGPQQTVELTAAENSRRRTSSLLQPTIRDVRECLESPENELREHASYVVYVCRVGVALARALGAVHREGLLHRDVKPSNVLLRRDGTPLLSDFGLARDTESTQVTEPGQFVGTLAYAAPEQLRGEQDKLDARTDVYGLGVTLYHALTLELPFRGRSTSALLREIERGRAVALRHVNPAAPHDLQTVVAKAMDADPARRYATADELADDLERLLKLQPIKARPAGLLTRTIKLAKRNRRSLTGAIAGGVLALLLATALIIHVFVRPGWVADHVREARLQLLAPGKADYIFASLLWGAERTAGQPTEWPEDYCAASLARYDRARRLAPFDETIRRERVVVAAARELCLSNCAGEGLLAQLGEISPAAARYVRAWAAAGGLPEILDPATLRGAAPGDLRSLGLLAFVCGDVQQALAAWDEYDQGGAADPLVDAAVGMLHLLSDAPQRAYPRLRDACQAFPDVGFLHVSQADAALQCGDYHRAELLLERAGAMERLDGTGGLRRVRADLYAATGRAEQAVEIWRRHTSVVAQYHYARYLESVGDLPNAALAYAWGGHTGRYEDAWDGFRRVARPWWRSLTPEERWRVLRVSMDEVPVRDRFPFGSLTYCLHFYAEFALLPQLGDIRELRRLDDAFPPGSLEAVALGLRPTGSRMGAGSHHYYSPWLKDLQATVLLSPWPVRGSLLLRAFVDVRRAFESASDREPSA